MLEKQRLPERANKIKRISDIDVSAGYDIVSFENSASIKYDKLIEVKTYIGAPHFYWSDNEVDVARIKGTKYYLCLVDYEQIDKDGYEPLFIKDPYSKIFSDDNWLVTTSSFYVQKIEEI